MVHVVRRVRVTCALLAFGRALAVIALVACASAPPAPPPKAAERLTLPTQIITPMTDGTPAELYERAERELVAQRWQNAVTLFEALLAGDPGNAHAPEAWLGLGLAYEGLERPDRARACYAEVASRFSHSPSARTALFRQPSMLVYMEDWRALGDAADALLALPDLEPVERMSALGARALARVHAGDDTGAMRDVQNGLDLVDSLHFGAAGRLPIPAAQLFLALGEVRRVRSDHVVLTPVTPDFVRKMELRCQGLLDAQSAYADAMRSLDPHWATMAGVAVGEMYRALHQDLMGIPAPANAKTEEQRQIFFGMMHVRYRVLLEKGLEMMHRTVALADKTHDDSSVWTQRARAAVDDMERALAEEKEKIAAFPFTEETLQKGLDILERKAAAAKPSTKPPAPASAKPSGAGPASH